MSERLPAGLALGLLGTLACVGFTPSVRAENLGDGGAESAEPAPALNAGPSLPLGPPPLPPLPSAEQPNTPAPSGGATKANERTASNSFPAEIQLTADSQALDTLLNRAVATGKVRALLAGGRILADRVEYDSISGSLYASGTVRFQRGNQYLQASRLRYNLNEQRGEVEEVYGYLDLEQSKQDFDLEAIPSLPLGPEQPMACPPRCRRCPIGIPTPGPPPSGAARPSTPTSARPSCSKEGCGRNTCWGSVSTAASTKPVRSPWNSTPP
ncbi:hypothetical protein [Cyanobium sp. ATX-6F1]|uniref:hypothetical protein n=1 Tax=Cyanobium sp. ATX-6F1 TaxID=3137388 RepID=UPI0039BE705E